MKTTNTMYWVFTILFAVLMIFSAIPDIVLSEQARQIMGDGLHYPDYFTRFIGVAKVLGSIAIVVPGFPRLKEWAYAGLFFDLIGAVYSSLATVGFMPQMLGMLIWIVPGILSYVYYHKRLKAQPSKAA